MARACTLVFPTGNGDQQGVQYPATLTEVIAVGATDENDNRVTGGTWGSNYGSELDVVAPGVNLWTTDITGTAAGYNDGTKGDPAGNYYSAFSGTSAAVPHVAGLAALILARDPGLSPDTIQDVIQRSADDVGPTGKDIYTGYGRINVHKALQEVRFIPVYGTFAQDATFTSGHVYLISNKVTVPSTVTLTIEAGVVVKFKYREGYLDVYGDLKLDGAPGKEVVFTSERDDTYGGDSNGDGKATSPAPGDWYCVLLRKSISPLHDAIFRYGDYTHDRGMVWIDNCSPTIKSCRFEHPVMVGLYFYADATKSFSFSDSYFVACPQAVFFKNTNPTSSFERNSINGSTDIPVKLVDGAIVDFGTTNVISNSPNRVIGVYGTISKNLTWSKIFFGTMEMPYLVGSTLTVDADTVLTIDPEVVVKLRYREGGIRVDGDMKLLSSNGKDAVFYLRTR